MLSGGGVELIKLDGFLIQLLNFLCSGTMINKQRSYGYLIF